MENEIIVLYIVYKVITQPKSYKYTERTNGGLAYNTETGELEGGGSKVITPF